MLTTHNVFMQNNMVTAAKNIYILLIKCFLLTGAFALQAGAQSSNNNVSPIWGPMNSSQNIISEPLQNDPNWGVLPSNQILNSDTARMRFGRNMNSTPRRQAYRDAMGNLLLTDAQGNLLRDPYGNPIVDSTAMNNATAIDDNVINSGPVTPPDDPIDVPIDGGVGILLMIGIGIGYKNSRKQKPSSILARA